MTLDDPLLRNIGSKSNNLFSIFWKLDPNENTEFEKSQIICHLSYDDFENLNSTLKKM